MGADSGSRAIGEHANVAKRIASSALGRGATLDVERNEATIRFKPDLIEFGPN
jgi:hypothetical protein